MGNALLRGLSLAVCTVVVPLASGQTDATKVDPNMRVKKVVTDNVTWHDPRQAPFRLLGFKWFAQDSVYRRLPVKPKHAISAAVNGLANHTAGGQVQFRTDSRRIQVRVSLDGNRPMYHMAQTGKCGFDIYTGEPGEQVFAGVSRFSGGAAEYVARLATNSTGKVQQYTVNFPLYNGVKSVEVGLVTGAKVEAPSPLVDDRAIVVYGTSITQGGCASRPGMCYTNILSRHLNREVVNLGFSGSGKGEPELARLIGEIDNKAMVVIDIEANTHGKLRKVLKPFIGELREINHDVPILVVSRIPLSRDATPRGLAQRRSLRDFQKGLVESLREAGDEYVHFQDGKDLLLEKWAHEATVDGTHPTDLGFIMMADALAPVIARILRE